jgi:phage shock protein C
MALQRLRHVFDKLDRRVQRVEDTVTAREYDWERRLRQPPKP